MGDRPAAARGADGGRDTGSIADSVRSRASLIAVLCFTVSVAYGALFYGFSVLISEAAAGQEFSRGLLSAAYGGAVLTGGMAAVPVGRLADRTGVRWLVATGALVGAAGLLAFAGARHGWQVLAAWWLLVGPATAMTFYEPAYVLVRQAFAPHARAEAIAVLTLVAGFSGPVFTPATGALVEALGWRSTTRLLALALVCAAPLALRFLRVRPPLADGPHDGGAPTEDAPERRRGAGVGLSVLRRPRPLLFTIGAVLAYGGIEAMVVHRVARFQELGFDLRTVTLWAGISGLVTLPGRFVLPMLSRRMRPTTILAVVIGVLGVSAALMVSGGAYWQMVASFLLFGLVFGAALPLRAIVMNEWVATAVFGRVMGIQAAFIAVGRAGVPALVGWMHDTLAGYAVPVALVAGGLAGAAVLVMTSGTGSRATTPGADPAA